MTRAALSGVLAALFTLSVAHSTRAQDTSDVARLDAPTRAAVEQRAAMSTAHSARRFR